MAMDDVVFLDRGTSHGLEVGSPLEVYRPIGVGLRQACRGSTVALPGRAPWRSSWSCARGRDGGCARDPRDGGAGPRRSLQGFGLSGWELLQVAGRQPRVPSPTGYGRIVAARLPSGVGRELPHPTSPVPGSLSTVGRSPGRPGSGGFRPLGFVARCTPGWRCRLHFAFRPEQACRALATSSDPEALLRSARRRGSRMRAAPSRGQKSSPGIGARGCCPSRPPPTRSVCASWSMLLRCWRSGVTHRCSGLPAVAIVGARAATTVTGGPSPGIWPRHWPGPGWCRLGSGRRCGRRGP